MEGDLSNYNGVSKRVGGKGAGAKEKKLKIKDFGKETINKVLLKKFKKKYGFSLTNQSNISKIGERMYNLRPF